MRDTRQTTMTSPRIEPFLALLVLSAGAPSCKKEAPAAQPPASCSAQVTDGNGRFWALATASAGSRQRPLKQQALKDACTLMCQQRQPAAAKGCVGRCLVDAATAKIGARVQCVGTKPAATAP